MVKELTRKMKDSGVEWIGEIPEDWEVSKYKRFTTNGMGSTILKEDLINSGIPVYSATKDSLVFGYLENPKIKLEKGDFIIPARGNSIGYVYMIKDKLATCTQTTIYSKINNDINKKYLLYQSKGLKDYWFEFDNTAIPQITVEQVANNRVLVPSMSEQNSIADFLDEKTQEIDNIISKSKKAIEEYKKYKQSLITETVTKGLDENVEMKDSGIEWIGEIPEHWDVRKLKNISLAFGSGTTPTTSNDKYYGGNISWIQSGDLYNRNVIQETSKCITETAVRDISTLKVYEKPFIVVAMYGASVGNTCISNINACVNQACCIIKPIGDLYYYYYCILTAKDYLLSTTSGGSQPNISQEKLKNLYIPRPNKWEQEQIAAYLDQKCTQIDQIISSKEKLLREMEAYKKSLIYETVTGKREVE